MGTRGKKVVKTPSLFKDYKNDDLEKKPKLVLPKIIKHDYGFEMQFGFKQTTEAEERQYQRTRNPYYVV